MVSERLPALGLVLFGSRPLVLLLQLGRLEERRVKPMLELELVLEQVLELKLALALALGSLPEPEQLLVLEPEPEQELMLEPE